MEIKDAGYDIQAKSFVPYMCPRSQYMLIVIRPVLNGANLSNEHQYFLMLNHQKHKVIKCRAAEGIDLPIKKFLFYSKNKLFCQNSTTIIECQLRESQNCFVLE